MIIVVGFMVLTFGAGMFALIIAVLTGEVLAFGTGIFALILAVIINNVLEKKPIDHHVITNHSNDNCR